MLGLGLGPTGLGLEPSGLELGPTGLGLGLSGLDYITDCNEEIESTSHFLCITLSILLPLFYNHKNSNKGNQVYTHPLHNSKGHCEVH